MLLRWKFFHLRGRLYKVSLTWFGALWSAAFFSFHSGPSARCGTWLAGSGASVDPHLTTEGRTRAPLWPQTPGSLKEDTVICLGAKGIKVRRISVIFMNVPRLWGTRARSYWLYWEDLLKGGFLKALQHRTFGTKESHSVVGAVSTGTLLLVEAPEAHGGVRMDLLSCFTGWDPFSGSCFDGPGVPTHPGTVVKANGFQLLVVSTATGVINVEPRGPLERVCASQTHQRSELALIPHSRSWKYITVGVEHRRTGLFMVTPPWSCIQTINANTFYTKCTLWATYTTIKFDW